MPRQIVEEAEASNNIKAQRVKKGLNQSDLAALLGLSKSGYIKWEKHPYNIPVDKLYKIAECLGCSVETFILV